MSRNVGLCRVAALDDDGQETAIILAPVMRFPQAVKLVEWKERSPALANGKAFRKGNAGTIFETTPAEAAEILRICEVDLAVLQGPNRGRKVSFNEDAGRPFVCDIKCRAIFRNRLTLDEMREDTELRSEPLIQQEFEGSFGPPLVEKANLNRLAAKIPELSRRLTTGSKKQRTA